ncbi:MAG: AAA family ATPase [Bacteroidales bacterium]|nr:AAA family ATPase [Bacteroidales bacterium]
MKRLPENTCVGGFLVQRFIKESLFNDNYVVTDNQDRLFFMKRFDLDAVPSKLKDEGTVKEILAVRKTRHPNVTAYVDDGEFTFDGVTYLYLVTPFYQGTLLSEALAEGRVFTPAEARELILPILEGLTALHSAGFNHNDITPRNILLEDVGDDKVVPRIIDLGHAHEPVADGTPPFPVKDLNMLYLAPEALKGVFAWECDSYAATAVLYAMLTGHAPWYCEISDRDDYNTRKMRVQAARRQELPLPDCLKQEENLRKAIVAGLSVRDQRPTVVRLQGIITGKLQPLPPDNRPVPPAPPKGGGDGKPAPEAPRDNNTGGDGGRDKDKDEMKVSVAMHRSTGGGGFADVAGMDALKKTLTERVIWVLRDKAKAAKYRLTPPNGMLLYGPPGCGKTFFAQKFAEESRFNYMLVNGSDLGSVYIHGTQGKIASLFKEAAAKAPTVICFDEFDAFVPTRGTRGAESKGEEINEFLSQLNNCAQRGIFVIGTTNRLDIIDPAILRKGRFDLQIEIPAPDAETRAAMFKIHLRKRPLANDIDVDKLSAMTDGYASSDIAFIVNEAAMVAALADSLICQRHLEEAIRCNPSSLTPRGQERRRIGY